MPAQELGVLGRASRNFAAGEEKIIFLVKNSLYFFFDRLEVFGFDFKAGSAPAPTLPLLEHEQPGSFLVFRLGLGLAK